MYKPAAYSIIEKKKLIECGQLMCHLQLKHQINTVPSAVAWSFAAPSAISLRCKSN